MCFLLTTKQEAPESRSICAGLLFIVPVMHVTVVCVMVGMCCVVRVCCVVRALTCVQEHSLLAESRCSPGHFSGPSSCVLGVLSSHN